MSSRDRVATYLTERAEKEVDSVMVAVHDTIMETTTVTVDRNETGDTVRVSTLTDRLRVRDCDAIATQRTKLEVRTDTVFVERRDSVFVEKTNDLNGAPREPPWLRGLKLALWIVIGLIGLVIVVRIKW